MQLKAISFVIPISWLAFVSILPLAKSNPYIIADDRVRSLDITPVLGRGYSIMTNSFQSTCLMVDETTVPSYNYDYSFYQFLEQKSMETEAAAALSHSFGYWWYRARVRSSARSAGTSQSETRYITASMRIERYYSSVREEVSPLSTDAVTLIDRQDYVGFFKACGPTYVRGIRRAQEVIAFFQFSSSSTENASSFSRSVAVSGWRSRYNSSTRVNTQHNAESSTVQIIIKGYGLGLNQEGSESFVAQNLSDFKRVMKFAFNTMTRAPDSFSIGQVYGMEVVPWVENTAFQVAAAVQEEVIEIPQILSLIPRSYLIADVTNFAFDNTSQETRDLSRCKNPTFFIDKFGYCCERTALYHRAEGEYDDTVPSERTCRPMRVLDPALIKDNMAANGEFVARLDRSVRYKLNQLSTLERCISAVWAIPDRYDFNLLKHQDTVKLNGSVEMNYSVFELKMSIDPFKDYSMLKHMAIELDEFLDMYIQPCYAAIFGTNVGTAPSTDPKYFMAYPWHAHKECTKLSCLGQSMRWDRDSEEGGCVPSMISGSESPTFETGNTSKNNCKKETDNGVLECKHNAGAMSALHGKTTQAWKHLVPRGRVDYFMDSFCMPDLKAEQLEVGAQQQLRKNYLQFVKGTSFEVLNVALKKPTSMSSTWGWWNSNNSEKAVDGDADGNHWHYSTIHSGHNDPNPSWEVNLQESFEIQEVIIYNRSDCCGWRLNGATVSIYLENALVRAETITNAQYKNTVPFGAQTFGDKVTIVSNGNTVLNLAEVVVNSIVEIESAHKGRLEVNERWYSPNRSMYLVYQKDGILTLYNDKGRAYWSSEGKSIHGVGNPCTNAFPNNGGKCKECTGDCDSDSDCEGDLRCFQRNSNGPDVPGCPWGTGISYKKTWYDFCYQPNAGNVNYISVTGGYAELVESGVNAGRLIVKDSANVSVYDNQVAGGQNSASLIIMDDKADSYPNGRMYILNGAGTVIWRSSTNDGCIRDCV